MTCNLVCENYSQKDIKLKLSEFEGSVVIEGNKEVFKFLGELLLSHSESDDCGFQLSPHGAGSMFFAGDAKLGLYFHSQPCKHDK